MTANVSVTGFSLLLAVALCFFILGLLPWVPEKYAYGVAGTLASVALLFLR